MKTKSITYLQSNAKDILKDLAETRDPYIITQNEKAKVVIKKIRIRLPYLKFLL